MRLFEAIIDANHRAVAGDQNASLHPADFADELPVIALTCVDPRLNRLLPEVLGVPEEQFIWLRNAGNIITSPLSSTMRSLALACAVKGGREIAVIGHTDCQICKVTVMQLLEQLKVRGVERIHLPENLNEFFGLFASERQNVLKAVDHIRRSPLIGPKIPVHGLMVDIETGKLEWLVNGYDASAETIATKFSRAVESVEHTWDAMKSLADFNIGEMKTPETKIGEVVTTAKDLIEQHWPKAHEPAKDSPPKIPLPPPLRPRMILHKAKK